VLDIGAPDNGANEVFSVKLRETQSSDTGRYACLSHCWGNPPRLLKTETQNYSERKRAIAWEDLPRTYQDAVRYVRLLGLQYLWIDSLCILQDSEEDLQRESAKMATIYQNSFLTLAASAAYDSSSRLNFQTPETYKAHKIQAIDPFGTSHDVYARLHFPHWYSSPLDMSSLLPLTTRGWAYQERLLSPRVLHFSVHEVIWECMETTQCECTLVPVYDTEHKRGHAHMLGEGTSREYVATTWYKIVHDFTRLQLTKPSDRLAAIAGCAKQIQPLRQGRYLAGLWEESFFEDLLWKTIMPSKTRPGSWRGPSWSWVSVDERVSFIGGNMGDTFARLIDADCSNRNGDPDVRLDSAHITISSQIKPAKLVHQDCQWAFGMRSGGLSILITTHDRQVSVHGPHFSPDYDLAAKGGGYIGSEDTVYCLRIGIIPRLGVECSIVLRCLNNERQQYERIGLLKQPLPSEGDSAPTTTPPLGRARHHHSDSLIDLLFTHEIPGIPLESVFETTENWYADVPERKELTIV
jgi:hypothetical protein